MKKCTLLLLAAAFLLTASQSAMAADEEVDMGKFPCTELTGTDVKNLPGMMMWVDGYMSAKSNNTVVDQEWMGELTTHMMTYCKENPNKTILDAMNAKLRQ